jgi:hypothetical protein
MSITDRNPRRPEHQKRHRNRQFESRNLHYTFLGEEPEPPSIVYNIFLGEEPESSSPLIGRTIICARSWRGLFVFPAPSPRRAPRRFAILVPNE